METENVSGGFTLLTIGGEVNDPRCGVEVDDSGKGWGRSMTPSATDLDY